MSESATRVMHVSFDEFRIRAWTVIRGSYLRAGPEYLEGIRALLA
jgi:hypothetical protein